MVPKKQRAAAGGEGNVICRSAGTSCRMGEEDEKELPPGPMLEMHNCFITELTEGRKERLENRR